MIATVFVLTILQLTTSSKLFYIYDWPHLVNRYANFSDRSHHGHGVEFPQWTLHYGAGRLLSKTDMEYKTSQFGLFKIMYERALIDGRRTLNPNEATTFLIPYDFGMDATFIEANGRMRKTGCPLASEALGLLEKSSFFQRHHGHDHVLIVSVNQNMNYFFNSPSCMKALMTCWNCTKLSIDEYMFIAQDRKVELANRGINWHAVPFPSDYHFDETVTHKNIVEEQHSAVDNKAAKHLKKIHMDVVKGEHLPPWERVDENRSTVVSFLGNPKKFSEISTQIREALVVQCEKHTEYCKHGSYKHDSAAFEKHHKASPNLESRSSIFCLQPPGDMPTRKSVFDSILSGCIPVLFHPLTATFMYEIHWNQSLWEEVAVHFDTVQENNDLIAQKVDFIEKLIVLYKNHPELIERKRQLIRDYAYSLQYSLIFRSNVTHSLQVSRRYTGEGSGVAGASGARHRHTQDAYDTSMSYVLAVHSGQRRHDRTSEYLKCEQISGVGGIKLQTSDHCYRFNSSRGVDPFTPPAVVSHLFKG